jgi:Ser/Thr protein kinase RdoA (MazF antagonist)
LGQQPYRRPAWPGLLPARPIFAPAHPDTSQAIASALGLSAPVFALQNAGGASPTFRIDADEPLFVKLVSPGRWEELREAEAIARWLAERGAPAIAAREVRPPQLPGGDFVVAYPFADGRPPIPARDAKAVGAAIASVHKTLIAHPDLASWQDRTNERLDSLVGIRTLLAAGALAAGPQPDELQVLAADRSISFLPGAHDSGPPRPLHGDLNIFNIVIEKDGARFIDFEDAVHSMLSVENELALVCERVILVQEPDDRAAGRAIDDLLDAYAQSGGDTFNRKALPDVLIGLSLRSLCTLATIDRSGHDTAEWKKFFNLLAAARRRRAVFN